MSTVANIIRYISPALVVSICLVLLCFYMHAKKKRRAYEVSLPTPDDRAVSIHTISLSDDQEEVERRYDRFPPRYSTVDPPPPYSLFDPKLTSVWPGGAPPAYEMYPITLPLAPHHWVTSTEPQHPTPSTSTTTHNRPPPQTLHQTSTT
ncbi:hypothetical protein PFLUV_G00245300 [Scomber scombrus]|uniref:Uncharacterized protein n=1 Tax=Scomber scombrus TaxID=13677 RepID=A0AAV1NXF1_SCOSC